MKFQSKYKIFIHKYASENIVYEIVAILSGGDELNEHIDAIDMLFIIFNYRVQQ